MSTAPRSIESLNRRFLWIDEAVRATQVDIWKRRVELWKGNVPTSPIDILDPGVALAARGYTVETQCSLGQAWVDGVRSEVAGIIDREKNVVSISQQFLPPVQRFTLAHELAHAVLHPNGGSMHRDLPLEKSGSVQRPEEIQANYFASMFLMTDRLVLQQFGACFRIRQFELTDEMAGALCQTSADCIRRRCKNLRQLSMLIAGADRFNGKNFLPLNSQFRVSITAMAIRLEDLRLVTF